MLRSVTTLPSFAAFALVCALASQAHAHEPPHGIGLAWPRPEADSTPIILTNRGLIFANDGGASRFSLRCNESYGVVSGARPELSLDDQGAVVIASTLDIQRTSDLSCTHSSATGLPTGDEAASLDLSLGGFATDPSKPGRALASTQAYKVPAQVFVSEDYARTWAPLSTNATLSVYKSLLIAEDGLHVLAGGSRYDQPKNKTLSIYAYSSDGGKTWTDADVDAVREPLGFLPGDSNIAFMREQLPNQVIDPRDKLLRSSDGGKTFELIGDTFPSLSAFAATPDGKTVWVGARFGGLFQSDDSGKTFARVLPDQINGSDCLYFRQDVLWACNNIAPNTDGIYTSKDLGKSFQEHMRFEEVATQVECADVEICEQAWRDWDYELRNGWNSTDGGPAPIEDAGARDAPDAGVTVELDAGHDAEREAGHDAGPEQPRKEEGCALGGRNEGGLLALALAALLRRRRR
ncbi:MAG TPA: hypothetical protein VFX59_03735 [Polyangiales bacterium]|nr:hypothetical protein [Polyangiales bacterium]